MELLPVHAWTVLQPRISERRATTTDIVKDFMFPVVKTTRRALQHGVDDEKKEKGEMNDVSPGSISRHDDENRSFVRCFVGG